MMNRVRLEIEPWKLRRLVIEKEIEEGATVKEIMNELSGSQREVIENFYDFKSQKLTGAAAIVLNGRLIQTLNGLETKMGKGDVLTFVPLLVGG